MMPGIFLVSTISSGFSAAGAQLDQQVGAAGQHLGQAGRTGQQLDGLIDRRRCGVIEPWHSCSRCLRALTRPARDWWCPGVTPQG